LLIIGGWSIWSTLQVDIRFQETLPSDHPQAMSLGTHRLLATTGLIAAILATPLAGYLTWCWARVSETTIERILKCLAVLLVASILAVLVPVAFLVYIEPTLKHMW
jgi:hypothetical protein